MNHLRVSPHEIDGEILQAFLPKGHLIDQDRDKRLGPLRQHLAEAYSVQAATTHLMQTDPEWDFMAVYFRAIDEISHHFMHYHPPKMEASCPEYKEQSGLIATTLRNASFSSCAEGFPAVFTLRADSEKHLQTANSVLRQSGTELPSRHFLQKVIS